MVRTPAVLLAALLWAGPLLAQIPEGVEGPYTPHPEARKAISRLLSPACPGRMLAECPTESSMALRDSIESLALEGMDADDLEAWMLANHGEAFRALPRAEGWGLVAWIVPALVLPVGFVALALALGKGRPGPPETASGLRSASDLPAAPDPGNGGLVDLSPDEVDRLREALRRFDRSGDPAP